MAKSGVRGDSKKAPIIKGRPKPSAPRAGFRADGNRYSCGGKVSKAKS